MTYAPLKPATRRPSIFHLAFCDMIAEWHLTVVAILSVAVTLSPLLILFGLKIGVVDTLRNDLASDPRNLELTLVASGSQRFDAEWFSEVRKRADVGFISPMTRGTVAHMIVRNPDDPRSPPMEVALLPSGEGDPVLRMSGITVPTELAIVVSQPVADALKTPVGATVLGLVSRTDGGRREAQRLSLRISGVVPLSLGQRNVAYVPADLIVAVEDYREWQRVEQFDWPGRPPTEDAFADFRLYAGSIDDVEPLRQWLLSQNIQVESAAALIDRVRRIDNDLSLLFRIIIILSTVGYCATLVLSQIAAVERKRTSLAILRMIGYRSIYIMGLPILQLICISVGGCSLALLVVLFSDHIIGLLFQDLIQPTHDLMRLPVIYAVAAVFGTVGLAASAGIAAALRIKTISPAIELRNV